jgi:DDE superfamily endonuclease/Helix-turn-helix of DDE superfamily endonuclease
MVAWRMDGKPRAARRFTVYKTCPLPTPEDRLFFLLTYLKTYTLQVVHGRLFGMVQGKANRWIHVLLPALRAALRALGDAPARSLTALAQRLGVSEAAAATVGTPLAEDSAPLAAAPAAVRVSPLLPMTARHGGSSIPKVLRQGPAAQTDCYSGKKKDHTVKNVLLVNAPLTILFLSETYGGRIHDKRIAEATPYPLPAGSQLLQDLGFLAFTLPQVEICMPTKKPRDQELTLEQEWANQTLHYRRLRIEHVHSSVKRCRIVKDRIRLWKQGIRDLVMELCCALHNFRVRLSPWQPMI